MSYLRVDSLSCRFQAEGGEDRGLSDVSFRVEGGSCTCIIGRSGVGKSTLLRAIAGLHQVSSGAVAVGSDEDEKVLQSEYEYVPPHDREIGFSFQKGRGLQPKKTVRENLLFPVTRGRTLLGVRGSDDSNENRVFQTGMDFWLCEAESVLGALVYGEDDDDIQRKKRTAVKEFLDKNVGELSGGQRQRVALARAFMRDDRVAYLLDEPFSGQDNPLRQKLLLHLKARIAEGADGDSDRSPAYIIVTHNQSEALGLADRILVLEPASFGDDVMHVEGQEYGPKDLYTAPCESSVASFIGDPCMNFMVGKWRHRDIQLGGRCRSLTDDWLGRSVGHAAESGDILVGVRPEDVHVHESRPEDDPSRWLFQGTIQGFRFEGEEYIVEMSSDDLGDLHALSGASFFQIQVHRQRGEEIGARWRNGELSETVFFSWSMEDTHFFSLDGSGARFTADDSHCGRIGD